jgi:hypothetical protein
MNPFRATRCARAFHAALLLVLLLLPDPAAAFSPRARPVPASPDAIRAHRPSVENGLAPAPERLRHFESKPAQAPAALPAAAPAPPRPPRARRHPAPSLLPRSLAPAATPAPVRGPPTPSL